MQRLDPQASSLLKEAGALARKAGHEAITTAHLLAVLLERHGELAADMGYSHDAALRELGKIGLANETAQDVGAKPPDASSAEPLLITTAVANRALQEAFDMGPLTIQLREDRLLLRMLEEECAAGALLSGLGINREVARRAVESAFRSA